MELTRDDFSPAYLGLLQPPLQLDCLEQTPVGGKSGRLGFDNLADLEHTSDRPSLPPETRPALRVH